MADDVDLAADLQAEHLNASLAAARVAVPAGVPGECEDCGDASPRLVGGCCARCRDRAARMSRLLGHPRPPIEEEEDVMVKQSTPPAPQPVQVNIKLMPGPVLDAVQARASADGLSIGPAARALLEELLAGEGSLPDDETTTIPLEQVHFDALLGEVARRFAEAGDRAAQLAAEARADALDAKLTALREALAA